tara:strand:+ start:191 stop:475 length:285 start_codon:yes stop_codon:yes gene_type:complete
MEQILFELLEQTAIVIALGIGIYALWKDKKETKKESKLERSAHAKTIKELIDKQQAELKYLNDYIRLRDIETLTALEDVTQAVENFIMLMTNPK